MADRGAEMRVLFLLSSLHGGGAERVGATLANAWAARGDEVMLLACYSGRGECDQDLDARVCVQWLADHVSGPRALRPVLKLRALRRLIRTWQPDRIVSFLTNVNVSVLLATRGLGVPLFVSERTDPAFSRNLEPSLRWLRRRTYPWATAVVVQTAQSAVHLRQVAPAVARVRVIPNPLPPALPAAREAEPATDRQILAALGRFNPVKQFDRLIEVFARLAPQFPQWDLVIWGEGSQRAACQARVRALGLQARIRLPGFSRTPWQDLLTAHGFVLNSRVEGFPNALLEAMALGLPCVATNCPSGPAELTRDGQDAALVPLGDEAALAAALAALMRMTPAERLARGRQAAQSVRARYALPGVLTAWDDMFAGTVSGGGVTMDPTSPLCVTHVISGLGHGGAETVLQRLVCAPGARVRHRVISMKDEGVIGPQLRRAGIEVQALEMRGVAGALRGMWRLYRSLRRTRPDVVQTWMYHADLLAGSVARLAGVRAVAWGVRNSGIDLARGSRSSRLAAWCCARVSGRIPGVILMCARRAVEVHARWGYRRDRMLVIPNGYDVARWYPDAADRIHWRAAWQVSETTQVVGCVARWNPLKDHDTLLAALAHCLQRQPDLRCVLIGTGMTADNPELAARARHWGVLDRLILLGRRDDVPSLMRGLDVHVLSSRAEGFPNVVCEAMASGVACVATDVGDAALILEDRGWLARPRDAQDLARAMGEALAAVQAPDWETRRAAARAAVEERYGLQRMVDRYETVWRRLAVDFPPRGGRRLVSPVTESGAAIASPAPRADADAASGSAPRLLFFVNNPAFFLSHRLPLALAARDAGYEVHVATMDGPSVAQIAAQGLEHHVVPLSRSGMRPWVEARSLWAFWRLLRRLRPQLVHLVTIKPVLYGGIACRLARVPAYVAAISGLGYVFTPRPGVRGLLRPLAMTLYRLALRRRASCRVIFQNAADRDTLLRPGIVRPAQVLMLRGSGVDLTRFSPTPPPADPVTVVMAARLLRDKGVQEFAQAARYVADQGITIRWRLAGSPDPGNPTSIDPALLQRWQDEGLLDYVGECEDVAAFYAHAHIVVLPSYREGLPKSLIEAAACGRPVVTTDVPGCRDAIDPGETGLLVPARDAEALAQAVMRLAADAALRARMGAAGRRLAERDFGLQKIVAAHLALYDQLSGRAAA